MVPAVLTVSEAPRVERHAVPADLLAPCEGTHGPYPDPATATQKMVAEWLVQVNGQLVSCAEKLRRVGEALGAP